LAILCYPLPMRIRAFALIPSDPASCLSRSLSLAKTRSRLSIATSYRDVHHLDGVHCSWSSSEQSSRSHLRPSQGPVADIRGHSLDFPILVHHPCEAILVQSRPMHANLSGLISSRNPSPSFWDLLQRNRFADRQTSVMGLACLPPLHQVQMLEYQIWIPAIYFVPHCSKISSAILHRLPVPS
jgi:hypothetical protein